ncbi:histidine kinase [Pantoea agglomerans Tx10]|uniref:EAL domain-containing protein n=1 Tax=Enterobacter agglomerans TaxID=549 RepID=UPI0003B19B98|nr:EAL domain-containing protein [Pantoea agglomerans]ERM09566.1 histidine kinase [Pantoea agglomerans Tx10]
MNEKLKDADARAACQQLIKSGEFKPFFQPIVSLEDQRVVGFELLARRILPEGLIVSPAEFIPAMEHHGLLNELMTSLAAQGFMTASTWPEHQFLSLNVSPSQLNGKHLPEILRKLAERYQFSLSRLRIEITETALIDDIETAHAELEALSEMGCMIAMDDFGTGCSSLAWLIQLPASTIKIDGSFIRSMLQKKDSRKIISSVVGLGRSLDMDVIAEGVETEEQAEMLRGIGCAYAQGYLFSRPIPAEETHNFLTAGSGRKFHSRLARMSLEQRAHQISSMYAAPDTSICFLSPELMIVDASDTFAARVGWPMQDIIHRHIFEVIPSQAEKLLWLQDFRTKGLPYPPFEVKLPGGSPDLVMITRVEDEAKDLLGFCVFGFNIDRQNSLVQP